MKRLLIASLASVAIVFSAGVSFSASKDHGHCALCGIQPGGAEVSVVRKDGKRAVYGCPKCAFTAENLQNLKSFTATDFFTRKKIDARKAYYVVETDVGACCPPYWLTFESLENAEQFAKGFEGDVMTLDEAVEWLKTTEHKGHDPEHDRYRRPYHDETHEHDWDH